MVQLQRTQSDLREVAMATITIKTPHDAILALSHIVVGQTDQERKERRALIRFIIKEGEATAIRVIAEATAAGVRAVADAIGDKGGLEAANLKVAQQYVDAFANLAKTSNTLILPAQAGDVASMVATAMTVLDKTRQAQVAAKAS